MVNTVELYFVAVMMIFLLAFGFIAVYFFIRQYRTEMRDKEAAKLKKAQEKADAQKHTET